MGKWENRELWGIWILGKATARDDGNDAKDKGQCRIFKFRGEIQLKVKSKQNKRKSVIDNISADNEHFARGATDSVTNWATESDR